MRIRPAGLVVFALTLSTWGAPLSIAAPPATTQAAEPLLTPAEAKDVDAVIASALAAGFPDAKGAAVYAGKVSVSATFDPARDPPPLPSAASNLQMTDPNSSKVTYGYEFNGLHFKLADGSWVLSCALHFSPKPGDKVTVDGAKEVAPATITADAVAAFPFDAARGAAAWLEGVPPDRRDRTVAMMNQLVPAMRYLHVGGDALSPAAVLLSRAGWPQGPALSLVIADQRSRNYWQLKPWTTPDVPFDPTGEYPSAKAEEEQWRAGQKTFAPEPPAVALRRALFRWCRGQMSVESPEDALLPLDVAAKVAKTMVDPKDPQHNAERIDALLAGQRLPVTPPENADLVARLQSWEARPRTPRMTVTSGGPNHGGPASISTAFSAPAAAYTPDEKDLDALVALLADERPSRFVDFNGPRTLGDNAWRAVAALLKADPRTLAGYPTDRPWTAAERKAAAAAVQVWWKGHRREVGGK